MEFIEKCKRPCFATSEDKTHGVIILKSGLSTGIIRSINEGKDVLRELTGSSRISPEDAERIEGHLNASDLPTSSQQYSAAKALGTLLDLALISWSSKEGHDLHKHQCSNCSHTWEHDGVECAGNPEAHTCSKCGRQQWTRVSKHSH